MWTIHDFPTYGHVARCVTKGYKGCPICGPNTVARYSKRMKKMVYTSDRH
jgi:ssDNA-binding Zn-finger/Zn-ribbon topoisomerase 1